MLLEVRAVGRKTPQDGRLDISESTFRRLTIIGDRLQGRVGESVAPATLERRACQRCSTHAESGGEHLFVVSEAFRSLAPGEHCVLELADDAVTIEVSRPHPLSP
ncbi:MAG: hypothetical protein JNJ98_19405 [Gemmatimonadetes bacterium]|nr:hypothetical protein [Gemmatimonadota bacterium]